MVIVGGLIALCADASAKFQETWGLSAEPLLVHTKGDKTIYRPEAHM